MIKTFIIVAKTADGFIAPSNPEGQIIPSTSWTSGKDKKIFVELTKKAGVIIMGLKTFQTIGRPLPNRLNVVYAPKDTPKIDGIEMTDKEPEEVLKDLEKRGFKEVAICGGSSIYTLFMKKGLVDFIYITVEPKIFGQGMSIFNQEIKVDLELNSFKNLDKDVLFLEYRVKK